MNIPSWAKLVLSIAGSEAAGGLGSIFTLSAIPTWYATLQRPTFAPPNWIFGPVWTTLYCLMGIAAFLVWKKGLNQVRVKRALTLFLGQLVLNALWSVLFFGLQAPGAAFIEIVFLWLAILGTLIAFYRVSKPAAWLLVPYLLWVSFAACLNFAFWRLN